jgi:hypothetical protein
MLVLFPAFSFIFGGSQLASALIIQNADSINTLILGMILQVVPLFMTPYLVKLSGSIVGKVAGIVNNPNKGPIDRARNFTKDRTDNIAAKRLGQQAKSHQFLRRNAQRRDHNRRRREGWKNSYGAMTDARWANSSDYSNIDQNTREAQERKSLGEAHSELRYSSQKIVNGRIQDLDIRIREVKLQSENAKLVSNVQWENNNTPRIAEEKLRARTLGDDLHLAKAINDNDYDRYKTKRYHDDHINEHTVNMRRLIEQARNVTENLSIQGIRKQSINQIIHSEFSDELIKNTTKQDIAGASIINDNGREFALGNAIATERSNYDKICKERGQLWKHFNVSSKDTNDLIHGVVDQVKGIYTSKDGTPIEFVFDGSDKFNIEAALDIKMAVGTLEERVKIMESSGGRLSKFSTTISNGMAQYNIAAKGAAFGGINIDNVGQKKFDGHDATLQATIDHIESGKVKAGDLADNDPFMIKMYNEAIRESGRFITDNNKKIEFQKRLKNISLNIHQILDHNTNVGKNASDKSVEQLIELYGRIKYGENRSPETEAAFKNEVKLLRGEE